MKTLYLVAGPNGSGKSTLAFSILARQALILSGDEKALSEVDLYLKALEEKKSLEEKKGLEEKNTNPVLYLDGDKLTKAMQIRYPHADSSSLMPQIFDQLIDEIFSKEQSLAIETNFYSKSVMERVYKAKAAGYKVELFYITLSSVELALSRVQIRALAGGLNVAKAEILKRYEDGIRMVNQYYSQFDRFTLLENEVGSVPSYMAAYENGKPYFLSESFPDWAANLFPFLKTF